MRIGPVLIFLVLMVQGCAGVTTFPTIARGGDTVSVMVGGSEKARKDTIQVVLTDANGAEWNLQSLGLVRSVFNLRMDGRASGLHYTDFVESYFPWFYGHEPIQTVLVTDIPSGVAPGNAVLSVNTGVDDDSSGISQPYSIDLEIIPGTGNSDDFLRQDGFSGELPVEFDRLEPAPHAKVSFSPGTGPGTIIGASSLVIDFDETVVSPDDVNIYAPVPVIRGDASSTGAFGGQQRMIYWHAEAGRIHVDIVAPQGINSNYLKIYAIHPDNVIGNVDFSLLSSNVFDVEGNDINMQPVIEYFP